MADETFEIGFVVSGQGDASEAFENLKLAEMQAREEAGQLSNELKRLKESGTATAGQIETTARAMIRAKQSATQLAAEARKVDQAQRAKAASAQSDANAARAATAAADAQSRSYAQLAGSMRGGMGAITGLTNTLTALTGASSETSRGITLVNSALGGVMQVVGMATSGMGPLGIAIGGVTAALGFFSASMQSARRDTDALQESAEKATLALDQLLARRRQQESEEARESRIRMGAGSVGEQESAIERQEMEVARLRQREEELNRRIQTARTFRELQSISNARGTLDQLTRSRRAAEAELESLRVLAVQARQIEDEITTEETMDGGDEASTGSSRRSGGRAGGRSQRMQDAEREAQALLQLQRTMSAEEVRIWEDSRAEMQRLELDHHDRSIDSFRQFSEERRSIMQAETVWYRQELLRQAETARQVQRDIDAEMRTMAEEGQRAEQAANQLADKEHEQQAQAKREQDQKMLSELEKVRNIEKQMWGDLAGTVASAAGSMASFLIEGAEGGADAFVAMLDAFLEATAVEYTIKALAEAANAVAAIARYEPAAAAAHATAAGLAAGVAAATGLASAAISVPDTGGAQVPSEAQPAPQNEAAGPASYNVSLFAPQAVFTEAERGQLLAHGFREARRQMGAGAVRY
jgi:hypothetical protein